MKIASPILKNFPSPVNCCATELFTYILNINFELLTQFLALNDKKYSRL